VAIVAPAPSASAKPPSPPEPLAQAAPTPPQDRQTRLIARVLKRVAAARQLAATKTVPGVFLSRDALIQRVKEHVAREVPHEAIRQEGIVLQLLGLLPTRFDYETETFALLESQLAGFYEPSDGTMYMASDLDDDNAQATLAHELVHSLQDQHWDLGKRSAYAPGEGDKSSAFSALAEGDATSAMADVLIAKSNPGATALDLPQELFTEQIIGSMSSGPTAHVPHIMKTSLVAPYIDGTLFVHALRRKGGWEAVNRAWEEPPVTSEQILHVDKWESHEAALKVSDPPAPGPGWKVDDSDVYGELGLRLSLEEWMGARDSGSNAAGWGGDRGVLLQKGETFAFAWRVRFDPAPGASPDAYAARTWEAMVPAIVAKLSPPAHGKDGAGAQAARQKPRPPHAPPYVCLERPGTGPIAMARRGRDIVFLAGPANVATAGWTSAGDCARSKAWMDEVFAAAK
jgi:hypothetical protein